MVIQRRTITSSKTFLDHLAPHKRAGCHAEDSERLDNSVTLASESSSGSSRSKDSLLGVFQPAQNEPGNSLLLQGGVYGEDDGELDAAPAMLLAPPNTLRLSRDRAFRSHGSGNLANQRHSDRCHRPCEAEGTDGKLSTFYVPRRHSSPGLAHILSHKLSTTFGHPTIIHRADLRQRPEIPDFSFSAISSTVLDLQKLGDNTQDDSDSSSSARSGSSPRTQSTNPTSDGDPLASIPKNSNKGGRNRGQTPPGSTPTNDKSCQADRITPSILTVEAAASARIFFEIYFNELFSGESPRFERRRELEERLYFSNLSTQERARAKLAWLLGRVVLALFALVREKQPLNESEETSRLESHGDQSHRRSSTLDVLKSAVEGTRSSRRKELDQTKRAVFAMKVIRKSDMIRNCQEGHLRAERDFLVASAKSRWIVPLISSFQDAHNLYLVMDFMIGGDFLSLLIRKNILSEDITRWYIAEMILCVEETHRLRWIHRDIKPDNFLISASGHLKISDFGLAFDGHWSHDQTYFMNQRQSLMSKLGIQVEGDNKDKKAAYEVAQAAAPGAAKLEPGRTHDRPPSIPGPGPNDDILRWRNRKQRKKLARSVVGTSQYMAPEVIKSEPYDGRCDWWSIGIILYEVRPFVLGSRIADAYLLKYIKCLYGFTPFAAKTRNDTKKRILHHYQTLYFPTDRPSDGLISDDAIDLIMRLLQEKEYRLCSEKYILNDFVHSGRIPGELLNFPSDKTVKGYRGYYVYSDDAADIKTHPFFKSIRWDELHYRTPPFIPKVKGWEDTKYFEGELVSDAPDGTSEASPPEEIDPADEAIKAQLDSSNAGVKSGGKSKSNVLAGLAVTFQNKPPKKKREKKRARDKILRDEQMGKTALEMRKRTAFLGYSYRRPKDVLLALEPERS
ncbi:conserved hypothetical protein [Uncinocarpus reesii 1704]|uniref:non-specific serine/threonine protein kinase n=1 Tax=Uncinocarpus reesii (strain UAMH 1704) TaxID=336963 RepID=C4JFL2_UNCRE|nr:uncharacterized protein UREG_01026 [Uncinocarpus reesii 1704]EEP76177.1 conserved hypothetical protein [Uncinocarpus reesii 1704]